MRKYILLVMLALFIASPSNAFFAKTTICDEATEACAQLDSNRSLRTTAMPYSWAIQEGNVTGHTGIDKFGHHSTLSTTRHEIWDGQAVYEFLADDTFATMYISSDATGDTSMTYEVQGIDEDYAFATATCTTNASDGFTFVACDSGGASGNDWWRIFRVKSTHSSAAAGNIYISKDNTDAGGDGIPDTATDIQAKVLIGFNQTLMTQWTVPVGKTFYLAALYGGAAALVANRTAHVELYVRPFGGVSQIKKIFPLNQGTFLVPFELPLIVPAKSDIIVKGIASGAVEMSAGFNGWYE